MMVFDMVAARISEKLDCAKEEILPQSVLGELGLDSLDTAELLLDISDAFGVDIELTEEIQTVGSLVEKIEALRKKE